MIHFCYAEYSPKFYAESAQPIEGRSKGSGDLIAIVSPMDLGQTTCSGDRYHPLNIERNRHAISPRSLTSCSPLCQTIRETSLGPSESRVTDRWYSRIRIPIAISRPRKNPRTAAFTSASAASTTPPLKLTVVATTALGGHGVPELLYPRPFGFHFLFFRSDVFLLLRSIAIRSCSASLDHSS